MIGQAYQNEKANRRNSRTYQQFLTYSDDVNDGNFCPILVQKSQNCVRKTNRHNLTMKNFEITELPPGFRPLATSTPKKKKPDPATHTSSQSASRLTISQFVHAVTPTTEEAADLTAPRQNSAPLPQNNVADVRDDWGSHNIAFRQSESNTFPRRGPVNSERISTTNDLYQMRHNQNQEHICTGGRLQSRNLFQIQPQQAVPALQSYQQTPTQYRKRGFDNFLGNRFPDPEIRERGFFSAGTVPSAGLNMYNSNNFTNRRRGPNVRNTTHSMSPHVNYVDQNFATVSPVVSELPVVVSSTINFILNETDIGGAPSPQSFNPLMRQGSGLIHPYNNSDAQIPGQPQLSGYPCWHNNCFLQFGQ